MAATGAMSQLQQLLRGLRTKGALASSLGSETITDFPRLAFQLVAKQEIATKPTIT